MSGLIIVLGELLVTIVTFLIYKRNIKTQKLITIIYIVIFAIILSFRTADVPDYAGYLKGFRYIDPNYNYGFHLLDKFYILGYEYGYIWFIWFFKNIFGNSPSLFFIFASVITSLISVYAINSIIENLRKKDLFGKNISHKNYFAGNVSNQSRDLPILFVVFTSYYGFCYEGVAIRAGLSMSMVLLVVALVLKKKFILGVIVTFVAFTFQRMAIIVIPMLFIIIFIPRIRRKILCILWGILGVFVLTASVNNFIPYITSLMTRLSSLWSALNYEVYTDTMGQVGAISKGMIWWWIIGWLFIFFCYEQDNVYRLFNCYLAGMFSYVIFSTIPGGGRVIDFFFLVNVPLIHEFYKKNVKLSNASKKVFIVVIVGVNAVISMRIWYFL